MSGHRNRPAHARHGPRRRHLGPADGDVADAARRPGGGAMSFRRTRSRWNRSSRTTGSSSRRPISRPWRSRRPQVASAQFRDGPRSRDGRRADGVAGVGGAPRRSRSPSRAGRRHSCCRACALCGRSPVPDRPDQGFRIERSYARMSKPAHARRPRRKVAIFKITLTLARPRKKPLCRDRSAAGRL